jgi:flagellar basal body-associated protein FliL
MKINTKQLAVSVIVVTLIGAVGIGAYFVLVGNKEPKYTDEEIATAVDSGACTEGQSAQLLANAEAITVPDDENQIDEITQAYASKGAAFEALLNCSIQLQNPDSALSAAKKAEEFYLLAGLTSQAEQMASAAGVIEDSLNFQEGEVVEEDPGEGDGSL